MHADVTSMLALQAGPQGRCHSPGTLNTFNTYCLTACMPLSTLYPLEHCKGLSKG